MTDTCTAAAPTPEQMAAAFAEDWDAPPAVVARCRRAILARLRRATETDRDEMVPWVELRRGLPGSREARAEALCDLHADGAVTLVVVRGVTVVGLGDALDEMLAAVAQIEHRVRSPRMV